MLRSARWTPKRALITRDRSTRRQRTTPCSDNVGPSINRLRHLRLMLGRQARPGTRRNTVRQPWQPKVVVAMNPVAQRLSIHSAKFGRISPGLPVQTNARANIRRAAWASRDPAAAREGPLHPEPSVLSQPPSKPPHIMQKPGNYISHTFEDHKRVRTKRHWYNFLAPSADWIVSRH